MKITEVYSPVVIVTLNRSEHLKRCIESLKKNTGAENTEIFIAVDYPPSSKYREGYNEVCRYLSQPIEGFKKVNIIYRNCNFGPIVNLFDVCDKVLEKFDRIIILEDDNELAPCFLNFCNTGLEIYKDDESIIGLNASNYVWCGKGMKSQKSYVQGIKKRQLLFHAFATWKKDYKEVFNWCISKEILNLSKNPKMMIKLRLKSRCFFYSFVENVLDSKTKLPWINDRIYPIDQVWDYYMMFYDKYMICPQISLTRDWGCDGSGANYTEEFENKEQVISVTLDKNKYFTGFDRKNVSVDRYEVYLHGIHTYNRPKSLWHAWKACLLRLVLRKSI